MDSRIRTTLTVGRGATSAKRLAAIGISGAEIARAIRAGDLVRIRRNALVDGELWRAAKPWERHELRARAVMTGLPKGHSVALSHHSALVVRGISVHGVDDRVHVVHVGTGRGRSDEVVVGHRPVAEDLVEVHEGLRIVAPAVACLQVAAQFGAEAALVSADHALHNKLIDRQGLDAALVAFAPGRWSRAPYQMSLLADARIESAAESRARWAFQMLGFRQPTPQVRIVDDDGELVARVDFLYEDLKVIIEVDGFGKYQTTADLIAEKVREDRLRALGYEFVRLTWADLADHRIVRRKVAAALARVAA
ncbi:MAG: endonuclease domain-containing protein [Janibacter sp.]|nr:endonuclease domain-containing protein [Janibacter sp.]